MITRREFVQSLSFGAALTVPGLASAAWDRSVMETPEVMVMLSNYPLYSFVGTSDIVRGVSGREPWFFNDGSKGLAPAWATAMAEVDGKEWVATYTAPDHAMIYGCVVYVPEWKYKRAMVFDRILSLVAGDTTAVRTGLISV